MPGLSFKKPLFPTWGCEGLHPGCLAGICLWCAQEQPPPPAWRRTTHRSETGGCSHCNEVFLQLMVMISLTMKIAFIWSISIKVSTLSRKSSYLVFINSNLRILRYLTESLKLKTLDQWIVNYRMGSTLSEGSGILTNRKTSFKLGLTYQTKGTALSIVYPLNVCAS